MSQRRKEGRKWKKNEELEIREEILMERLGCWLKNTK
jgi:hypothetical protein